MKCTLLLLPHGRNASCRGSDAKVINIEADQGAPVLDVDERPARHQLHASNALLVEGTTRNKFGSQRVGDDGLRHRLPYDRLDKDLLLIRYDNGRNATAGKY